MYLHIKCKILTEANATIPDGQAVSVIAAFLNSFQKVVVSINSVEVYSCPNFAYANYITTVLHKPAAEHERLNDSEHLFLDTAVINNVTTNSGWRARSQVYAGSKLVESFGVLNIPLFNGQRYFPPNTRIDISLYTMSPQFLIQAQAPATPAPTAGAPALPAPPMQTWKLEFHKSVMHYQSIECTDDFLYKHKLMFEKHPVNILFVDYKVFVVNLKANSRDVTTPQYQLNSFPRRIYIGFVSETAFLGTFDSSPFNFEHFNVAKVKLTIGDTVMQQTVDPGEGQNQELFFWLHRSLGLRNNDSGFHISSDTPNTLRNNYLFCFDVSPGMNADCYEFYSATPKQAVFSIEVLFKEGLPQNVALICMCETDQILQIKSNDDPVVINPSSLE